MVVGSFFFLRLGTAHASERQHHQRADPNALTLDVLRNGIGIGTATTAAAFGTATVTIP
jgi:hypothetical protein